MTMPSYANTELDPGEPFQYESTWIRIQNTGSPCNSKHEARLLGEIVDTIPNRLAKLGWVEIMTFEKDPDLELFRVSINILKY